MSLKKNISLSFVSQLLNLVIAFALSILSSRVLGAEGRGEYILVLTSAGFLVQFFSLGLDSSISHYIASKKVRKEKLISTIIVTIFIIIFLMVTAIVLTSGLTSNFLVPKKSAYYYGVLFLLALFMLVNSIFAAILNGEKKFNSVIYISFLAQILTLLFYIYLFLFYPSKNINPQLILSLTVCVYLVITIIYAHTYIRFIAIRPSWHFLSREDLKKFFSYSIISFACSVLQFLSYKMDFWIVNYYLGAKSLGIYSLSSSLAQLLWILPQSIATILFPMSSYYTLNELPNITGRLSRISLFITFLAVTLLIFASPFIIPYLFGKEFTESVRYFQFFLLGVFPFVLIKLIASVFAGIGKIKYNLIATIVGFVSGFLVYITLIPFLGLIGGVIGSVVSYIFTTVLGFYFYKKEFDRPLSDLVIIKKQDIQYIVSQVKTFKL